MAKFDIKAHIQDHADYCEIKENIKDFIHFTFSFEDIQFFNRPEPPQEILKKFLEELFKEKEYKVKNGWDTLANGKKVQRYAKRKINLGELTQGWAIHIQGSQGEHTHPHPHLLLLANGRYGKNFSLLRQHISKISEKFGLIPHFDEIKETKLKNLHDSVKRFFWLLKKKPSKDFKEYFFKRENKELLARMLDKLEQYTKQTNNTLFYFKTLQSLQKRLKDNKIDFYWNEHNIREIITVENILTENDLKVIDLINQKKFNQKDIKPYIANPILKDFARYCYYKNLKKTYIIKGLKETTLLNNPQPNSKLLNNFLKLYERQNKTKKRKSQLSKDDNLALYFKNKLLEIAKKSANEKELRNNLLSEYNIQLKLKKRKGKVIGYTFIYQNQEHYFKDEEIIKISDLREILKNNSQNKTKINLPVVYKKELKYEELQRFSNEIERTITRANIVKSGIKTEIEKTDRKLQSIYNQREQLLNDREKRRNQFIEKYDKEIERRERETQSRKSIFNKAIETIKGTISRIRNKISEFTKFENRLSELKGQIQRIGRVIGNYIIKHPKMWDKINQLEKINLLNKSDIDYFKTEITLKKTEIMLKKQRKRDNDNYLSL